MCNHISSQDISFSWKHPIDDGGVPISHYELKYIEIVPHEHQTLGESKTSQKGSNKKRINIVVALWS